MAGADSKDEMQARPPEPVGAVHRRSEPSSDAEGAGRGWTLSGFAVALLVFIGMIAVLVIWLQSAYQVVPT